MLSISNFVLEIINIIAMKKALLVFVIVGLILASLGLWYYNMPASDRSNPIEWLHFGVILVVVLFALFFGFKRLSSARRGEPVEDERSKRVMERTAALSYYISLYFWVFLLFIKDRIAFDQEELLGTGILGMAVSFAISWLVVHFRGIRNE